jgi:hypothetical protein
MQDRRPKPSPPRQLSIPLETTRLAGMTPLDRRQVVTSLAGLLREAAGVVDTEQDDDGR